MKKRLFRLSVTAIMLLATVSASARFDAAKKDAPRFYAGLRAGAGVTTYYNLEDPIALATPLGGVALGFRVARVPLYLETGAYYQNMGSKFENRWSDKYYNGYSSSSHESSTRSYEKYKVNNHSLMVPLVATYRFYASDNITLQPFTGFFGSYGFDAKAMDFGLREGFGCSFGHLHVNLGVNLGLVGQDVNNDDTGAWVRDAYHLSLFLGIGLDF